jgi:hypothetical protein
MPNLTADRPLFTQAFILSAALICGFGLWLIVQLTETKEVNLDIKVVPVNVPAEVVLTLQPDVVRTKFSYPSIEEAKMRSENFYVEVDFSDLKRRIGRKLSEDGDRTITREQVRDRIDAGRINVTVVDLITPQVTWKAALRHTRAIIEPVITGKPADGFVFNPGSFSDERGNDLTVLLSDKKEDELKKLGTLPLVIKTKAIDISGLSGVINRSADLDLPPGVSLVPEEEDQLTRNLFIEITEETISRTLENVPVRYQFISAAQGLRAAITPATVNVTVTGRSSLAKEVTPEMIAFGLFGVVERAGETREVAIDALITDSRLQQENLVLTTDPRTVVVKVVEERAEIPPPTAAPTAAPTASPTPAPAPTATPTATPVAVSPTPDIPTPKPNLPPN